MLPNPQHLYVHVPFCPSKCSYCAFVTHVGSLKLVEPYLDALGREAEIVAELRPAAPLRSIYLGGGTPSLLSPAQLAGLLHRLAAIFPVASDCEISIEAHPDTADADKLRGFRRAGVTRLSAGAESLDSAELALLGRRHGAEGPRRLATEVRQAGLLSINLDLMYGLPSQTLQSWRRTLEAALATGVDHLSLYPLAVEPRTVFARLRRRGELPLPEDETVAEMYHLACRVLGAEGFVHYEVANWARPGHQCRHNLAYWQNREFFGLGVGAHAYLHPRRSENVPRLRRYLELIGAGERPVARFEVIEPEIEIAETVMLGLRLLEQGLDLEETGRRLGLDLAARFATPIGELREAGLLELRGGRLVLPEAAVPVANEVWQRFMSN